MILQRYHFFVIILSADFPKLFEKGVFNVGVFTHSNVELRMKNGQLLNVFAFNISLKWFGLDDFIVSALNFSQLAIFGNQF